MCTRELVSPIKCWSHASLKQDYVDESGRGHDHAPSVSHDMLRLSIECPCYIVKMKLPETLKILQPCMSAMHTPTP